MKLSSTEINQRFQSQLGLSQIAALLLYGILFKKVLPNSENDPAAQKAAEHNLLVYPFFQATHLMVVLGFALLLTFIHRHRLTTMVTCLWVGCLSAQFYFIWNAIWTLVFTGTIHPITLDRLATGEFAAASVLIAVCGIIGKASNYQYFLLTMLFMPAYALNESFVLEVLGVRDVGGSMVIHAFGACFGLAVAFHLKYPNGEPHNKNLHPSQASFTTALLGTILLWALWPAFNGAAADSAAAANLAVINTYIGLFSSVIGTLLASIYFYRGKFNLDQLANATLAGGVIMGSSADMIHSGFVAEFMGLAAGIGSCALFQYAPPILLSNGLHDVAGIFNLHFVPGVVGGFLSVIFRAIWLGDGADCQFLGLCLSVGIAALAGNFTGKFIYPFNGAEKPNDYFNDDFFVALEGHMHDKLKYYDQAVHDNEKELFEHGQNRSSMLSERLLEEQRIQGGKSGP
jgi:ammonium transporter Rh